MSASGILTETLPELDSPLLVAGFEGWANALQIPQRMVSYLIRKVRAKPFATLDSDMYYRYDEDRPLVEVEDGVLKDVNPPGGTFYAAHTGPDCGDLLLLQADEPSLGWFHFVGDFVALCRKLGVKQIITLGSMYDNVLHTDKIISGIASSQELRGRLSEKGVRPVNYQGPSSIHSLIQKQGEKLGFQCISLWCHCPYYLQGATHFGILSHLGSLLAYLGRFELDTSELDTSWKELNKQIQMLIQKNPDLQSMIDKLRREKLRGSWESLKKSASQSEKVIPLSDFMKP